MLLRLVDENPVERRRQRDAAERVFGRLELRHDGRGRPGDSRPGPSRVGHRSDDDCFHRHRLGGFFAGGGHLRRRRIRVADRSEFDHLDRGLGRRGRRGRRFDRRRRQDGSAAGRELRFDRTDGGEERRRIGLNPTCAPEVGHPGAEALLRGADHRQHGRGDGAIVLEQQVQDLLDVEGKLPQFRESNHPAAAFQRMEAPPDGAQRFSGARALLEFHTVRGHGVEHLGGLRQVDVEELGIEAAFVRREEPLGFRRYRRRRRGGTAVGDRLDRRGKGALAAGRELLQRRPGLPDKVLVADQLGVVAQARQFRLQALANRRIRRRAVHPGDDLRQRAAQRRDLRLDGLAAVGRRCRRRPAEAPREQRRDQAVAVGSLLLDGLDVEAQAGQRLGEQLEVVVRDGGVGIGIGVDLVLAKPEELVRLVEAQDAQRPANLAAVLRQRRELGALAVVAEERVQHLLDVPQVDLDLADDLRDQQPLLRALRHLVEQRRGAGRPGGPVGLRGIEAGQHHVDLLREIRRQAGKILECAFGEQEARRVLHRQRLGHAERRHRVQTFRQRGSERHQRGVADVGGLGVHDRHRLLQPHEVLAASGSELDPGILGHRELLARGAPQRLDADRIGRERRRRGHQAAQAESFLDGAHGRGHRLADCDVIEHFPPQAVSDLGRALDQAADLQVDPRRELLQPERRVQALAVDRVEHRAGRPPERAQACLCGEPLDHPDGIPHRARAGRLGTQP